MAQLEFQFAGGWNRRARWLTVVREYALAIGLVLLSLGLRIALDPHFAGQVPYLTFYLAIIVAVRFTGPGPSLAAILTSWCLGSWFFVEPRYSFSPKNQGEWLNSAFFFISCFALLIFAIKGKRALDRERRAIKALEAQALELAASEELNRRMLASSTDSIILLTLDGLLVSMSEGGKRLLEMTDLSKVLRKPWLDLWPQEYRLRISEAIKRACSGEHDRFEASCWTAGNHQRWWDVVITPVCDRKNRPERLLVISRDITERRQAEAARKISEERRRLAMAAIDDAVWDLDLRQDSFAVNENFEKIYGKPTGSHWQHWRRKHVHPQDFKRVDAALHAALKGNSAHWTSEYRLLRTDGKWGQVLDRAFIARDENGQARRVVGAIMDLTPLRLAERRTQLLARTSGALLRTDSPQKVIQELCQSVMEFLDCELFVNFLVDTSSGCLHLNAGEGLGPDCEAKLRSTPMGSVISGCAVEARRPVVVKDLQLSTDPRLALMKNHGCQAYACTPLMVNQQVIGTLSFGTRNRTEFQDEELSLMKAVADQVAVALERQRSALELRRVNEELEKRVIDRTRSLRETTEQLNSFCYSIAHDLRAPLRTQTSFARLLLDEYDSKLDDTGRYYLRAIMQAAERQSNIIHDLMAHVNVSRADLPVEPVSLRQAFEEVRADLEVELLQKHAVLEVSSLEGELVMANRSSLHLVLLNLVSNACKFVAASVVPQVRLWTENSQAGRLRLWVKDNGIGIDPKDAGRLFGMFQRLQKGEFPGTGMGLAIVKTAVERMGGTVGFESQPGSGSRFWVELPRAKTQTATARSHNLETFAN